MKKKKHIIVDREQIIGLLQENKKEHPEDKVYFRFYKNLAIIGFIDKYGNYYHEALVSVEQD